MYATARMCLCVSVPMQMAAAPAAGPTAQPFNMFGGGGGGAGGGGAAAAAGGDDANPLAYLRNNPQFAMLRAAVQANPQMLVPLLQVRRRWQCSGALDEAHG